MLATPSLLLFLILVGTDAANLIKGPLYNPRCGAVPKAAPIPRSSIVGVSEAQPGAWPWQIRLFDEGQGKSREICVGTLISSDFVLTTANCLRIGADWVAVRNLSIVAGENNLADRDSGDRQERLVARVLVHPHYNFRDNDIALLKLDRPLELTAKVWPACLPSQGEELEPRTTAITLGWSAKSHVNNTNGKPNMESNLMLREARVRVVNFDDCKQNYKDHHWKLIINHHVVCAGYKKGQIDSCHSDPGGPLLVERDNRWYVHGATSFGDECDNNGRYTIYSKTSSYINWIHQTVYEFSTGRSDQQRPVLYDIARSQATPSLMPSERDKCLLLPKQAEHVRLVEGVDKTFHDNLENQYLKELAMCATYYEQRMGLFQADFQLYSSLIVDFTREAGNFCLTFVDGEPPEEAVVRLNEALFRLFESRVAGGSPRAGEYPWEVYKLPYQLKQACTVLMEYLDSDFSSMAALPLGLVNKGKEDLQRNVTEQQRYVNDQQRYEKVCHQLRRINFMIAFEP